MLIKGQMRNAECGLRNLNAQQLFFNLFVKIFRTPNSALRTCSRLLSIICVALLLGCGYQMVGMQTQVPPGMHSIAIPTFANLTFEPGIEVQLTQGFLREFMFDRRARVVGRKEADSILEGVIKSFRIFSVAYNQSGIALEYQITLVVDLTFKKQTGEVVWRELNLTENRFYRTAPSAVSSESNKAAAVQMIGSIMAERILNRVFHEF